MASPSPDAAASVGDEQQTALKRKRNLPGTPDPQAEVIALSPKTLMATNRFLCEVCGKGFQRDQNLQLHRRGHNLPWKLKQREGQEIKKRVYVCPEVTCVHHDPSRALGDLTGIKKHFSRKHGEKKWKCEKCSKRYAVHSDWKAHQKVCGTREYRCYCGTLFSRRDSFVTHRAFCEALAAESARASSHGGDETQHSGGLENNAVGSAGVELVDAPMSPYSQPTMSPYSQPTSGEPHSEVVEPIIRDGYRADIPLMESIVSSSASGSAQGHIAMASQVSSRGPGLSLCLGTGLGPGPPGASDNTGCVPRSEGKGASKQMNNFFPVDSERAERTRWSLPLASAGIFSSMLAAPNTDVEPQGYATGRYSSSGMAGLSIGMNSLTSNTTNSQFASSTSYLENAFISPTRHRQHTGSQLPATTLLQKAAMMGSTKSSSFLFRNLGLSRDSRALSPEESVQHHSWAGVTSSSSWQSSASKRPGAAELRLDCGRGYETPSAGGSYCPLYGGHEKTLEFRDSLCSGAARPQNTFHVDASSAEDFLRDRTDRYQRVGHMHTEHEGAMSQGGLPCTELEGAQRNERYEGNRMTLDFLGVGGQSRSTGLSMEGRQNLCQRDVADSNLLTSQAKLEPRTHRQDNMQARTGGHSASSES